MRHVSWRYGELGSSAMSRQPVGSWGFPGPCSTAGKIDMSATVEMGFTHDVKRRAGGVPTACRSRTSRRFWRWHCLIPPADLASMRCNWLDSTDSCRPARSIERCDAWIWELGSSDSSSWNDTVLSEPVCSRSARDGNCSAPRRQRRHVEANEPGELVCLGHLLHRSTQKGWGKFGRSRPAMQPARTRLHASSRPTPLSTLSVSSWRSSCLSTKRLIGRFSES